MNINVVIYMQQFVYL